MRLGLVAAARITGPAVIEAAVPLDDVEVVAIAARSPGRARAAADQWGIARAHDSYESLVADPDVDAVYVATPAALHHRWSVAALRAGKHVLCEKPFTSNVHEARDLVREADRADRVLMEAYHWRYHPFVARLARVLDAAPVGHVERVDGRFLVPEGRIGPEDIRWDRSLGGGALMDLGCYPLQWLRFVGHRLGLGEPDVVDASATCPVPDVDGALTAGFSWSGGRVTGGIECSMISTEPTFAADLVITGTDGTVVVTNPLAPQHGASIEVLDVHGNVRRRVEQAPSSVTEPASTTYRWQLAAFRDAVVHETPVPTGGADAIATMALIDACYVAAGLTPRPSLDHR